MAAGLVGMFFLGGWGIPGGGKSEKEMIAELQTEVTLLQRQLRDLQESSDKNAGQMISLLNQVSDTSSGTARDIRNVQQTMQRSQGDVSTALTTTNSQMSQLNERMNIGDGRIEKLSAQIEEVRKLIEQAGKSPFGGLSATTVTSPDQLFSAAYSDFARGNYDLSISEFKLYLEMYGTTEAADNAQFWIGEALLSQKKYSEAEAAFESVYAKYPKGDKAVTARLKQALALMQLNRNDEAIKLFQQIVRTYPALPEAQLAKQYLEQLGAPLEDPARRRPGKF